MNPPPLPKLPIGLSSLGRGATESIKCLHSHTADELSTGKNAIGKIVVESIGSFNCEEVCINPETFEKNKNWKVIW